MSAGRQRVVVVTGGGGGIGAAIAEELGRRGTHVVTVDPLVTLDGAEQLPASEETTAGRIVAAGGSAQASPLSVTDAAGLQALFAELVADRGGVDGVVNVAGITRPTGFATGREADWLEVLQVHLDGYVNVLAAALPHMAAAGYGRIVGVTSGSGWRAANAGAYSCAKRAVASLTWQLGAQAPHGVVVNAMSPIAVTRMVTAALGRAAKQGSGGAKSSATGGLSLGSMPGPEELGPIGAHLASESLDWCSGRVLFTGGSELAVVDPPGLIEVVRTSGVASLAHLVDAVVPGALAPAEAAQGSTGGSNPRFGPAMGAADGEVVGARGTCAVVSDRPALAAAVVAALEARGVATRPIALAGELPDDVHSVVLAPAGGAGSSGTGWEQVLSEHAGIVDQIHADASWARAAADAGRPIRLVTLTDATTAGGRSRAQAVAQLARSSRGATEDRVAACSVAVESAAADDLAVAGALAAHLVAHPEAPALAGAELVVGAGWLALRSHPRPRASISYGGPELPAWLDAALQEIVR